MQLKELNHRSPVRVLERSMQGGLGAGNVGVVAARAGVGKSGFLTSVAVDALLRDRKVLHVSRKHSVGHVRDYYDEIFTDLARSARLEETVVARRKIDGNRFIHSSQGLPFDADRLARTIEVLRDEADFAPDLIVVDGHVAEDGEDLPRRLSELARGAGAELWLSVRVHREDLTADWHDMPPPLAPIAELAAVIVLLQPTDDGIHIRLLKDHERQDVEDPGLVLDPTTFLVREA